MAVAALGALLAAPAQAHQPRVQPLVAELYTAQGCVSCNKAYAPFTELASRRGVIALTLPVDYWDYLGWRDAFADPAFTARQKAYEHHFGLREVYTPQLVLEGRGQASADDSKMVEALWVRVRREARPGPALTLMRDGRLHVAAAAAPGGRARVWMLRFEPNPAPVRVTGGDNKGAVVSYRNVVRELVDLGEWRGEGRTFRLPKATSPGLMAVILVQRDHGGPILAARLLPSPGTRTAP